METSTTSPSSTRATAILLVVVALVAGAVIGAVGERLYLIRTRQFFPRHAEGMMAHRAVDRLDHDLALTPQQRTQIEQIVERHHQRIEQITATARPQVRQELDAANAEISSILTPQQRQKFEALRFHMRSRAPRRGFGPPPGMMPGTASPEPPR